MEAKRIRLDVTATIIELPKEMWLKIFSFLPQKDHHAVGLVSNRFQKIIDCVKLAETPILEITENNVQEVKAAIANKNCKFCFKRVKLENVTNIADLNYILQSIGKQIQFLSIKNTPAFELLKCNVIYLKSLEIYFDDYLQRSVNNGSINLRTFPRLEQLTFLNNLEMYSTTIKLLEQLKLLKNKLKYFKLCCSIEAEEYLTKSLLQHTNMLETLELHFCDNYENDYHYMDYSKKWDIPFSRMKNLKNFRLSGNFSDVMLKSFFSKIPKETSFEHLQLVGKTSLDINKTFSAIVEKWINSLQYLELNLSCDNFQLTDVAVMELGKLQKLRVLKLLNCPEITKMGLLMGIAIEENMIMEELHLENIPKLDEMGLRITVSRFPNLRVLILKDLENAITNISLASIWRYPTRLRSLSIDNFLNITDDGLIGYGNNAYSIKRLRLLENLTLNCSCLTDRTLIEALHLPALRKLELGDCHNITMKGIESLVKGCPFLEVLSLPSTVMISENALFVIGNGLKRLRMLIITDCYNITKEVCDYMTEVFETLRDSITDATFSPDCQMKMLT